MTLDIKKLFLCEGPYGYDRLSFAGRKDTSGIRGGGSIAKTRNRADSYPYDRQNTYGQPDWYDRGSHGNGGLRRALTPKSTEHSSFNEYVEEAMGTPQFSNKGNTSQIGSSVPGSGGIWSNDPPKDWDEDLEESGPLSIDPRPPDIEHTPNSDDGGESSDLETRMNAMLSDFEADKPDAHVMAPDPYGVVFARLSSRGIRGLIPKESSWDRADSRLSSIYRGRRYKSDDLE